MQNLSFFILFVCGDVGRRGGKMKKKMKEESGGEEGKVKDKCLFV